MQMLMYIILVLNCSISNTVVGVFGEARGAYSRPAPDLMVLERIQSLRGALSPSHPFPYISISLSSILPEKLNCQIIRCVIIFVLSSMCYDFYCSFIYVLSFLLLFHLGTFSEHSLSNLISIFNIILPPPFLLLIPIFLKIPVESLTLTWEKIENVFIHFINNFYLLLFNISLQSQLGDGYQRDSYYYMCFI